LVAGGLLTAGASAADLTTESPQQILKASTSALKAANGYEMHISSHGPGTSESGTLVYSKHGGISMRVRLNKSKLGLVIIGKRAYFKASAPFWVSYGSTKSLAALLAPHWYKLPASKLGSLTGSGLGKSTASSLTKCEAKTSSELTNAGTATVDGHPAVLLKSPGTTPGTHPETIAIATTGKPYLLRVAITGPAKPGPISACNIPDEDKQTGTTTINHWNSAPPVKAPPNAIKLPTK
jgi:hypothetical protein